MNRQGFDIGSQYRSAIFFHDEAQQVAALDSLEKEQSNRRRRIVTQVEPAAEFWKAEDYHQQYLEKRGPGELRRQRRLKVAASPRMPAPSRSSSSMAPSCVPVLPALGAVGHTAD